jgi:AcrR family transcriptional regulator
MTDVVELRRARPRRSQLASDEDLRRSIFAAGKAEILANGYGAMSFKAVARRAGIPLRTASRLMPTKLDLLRGMIQDTMDEFLSRMALAVNGRDLLASLETILVECACLILNPSAVGLKRIAIAERELFPEIADALYSEGMERMPVALAAWLSAQRDRKAIDVDDPQTIAKMLVGMMTSDLHRDAMMGRRLPALEEEVRIRAHRCASLFLNGCATRH